MGIPIFVELRTQFGDFVGGEFLAAIRADGLCKFTGFNLLVLFRQKIIFLRQVLDVLFAQLYRVVVALNGLLVELLLFFDVRVVIFGSVKFILNSQKFFTLLGLKLNLLIMILLG